MHKNIQFKYSFRNYFLLEVPASLWKHSNTQIPIQSQSFDFVIIDYIDWGQYGRPPIDKQAQIRKSINGATF